MKLCVILGPTASGKSKLAVELAKTLNGEIVSADSMQIYKDMDIATAKPTQAERLDVKHHLIDFLEPSDTFSVAEYTKLAHGAIEDISKRGKLPILAGGTGLYINSVLDDIKFIEQENNEAIRQNLTKREKSEGIEVLYQELKDIDPETAKRTNINNKKRILRALEIYLNTGITMSEQLEISKPKESRYEPIIIGLNFRDRENLYERINKRVDEMFDNGLLEEAQKIYKSDCGKTAVAAIGYKELFPYFKAECSLEKAIENIKQSTRRYAKRQITWFKRDNRINWIYVDDYSDFSEIRKQSESILGDFLKS